MSLAVQLQDAGNVVAFLGAPLLITELVMWWRGNGQPMLEAAAYGCFAVGDLLYGTGELLRADWPGAAFNYAVAAFFAWLAWRRWRKHRKAIAALLGAKSRAIRDALVRKAREAAIPRPVLQPVPGGAA